MPTPQIPNISSNATLEELRDCYIGMVRYMTYLLSALDTLNINRLDAKVIIAESITAGKLAADSVETQNLKAGAITTEKIDAGAVTAEKITVDELSAITANLGHITAGLIESIKLISSEIYGSLIATREGTFPRAEMNSTNDLFGAYQDANNFIRMVANYAGTAAMEFVTNNEMKGRITSYLGTLAIEGYNGLTVSAYNGDLDLLSNEVVRFSGTDWRAIRNEANSTLQDEFDEMSDVINGKATSGISTSLSGSANGGIPIGTKLAVEGGGFVTWTGIPSHSHAQN